MYYLEGQGGGGLHVSLNLERVFTTVAVGGETWGVVGQEKHLQGSVLMVLPELAVYTNRQLLHSSHDNNSCLVEHVAYVS